MNPLVPFRLRAAIENTAAMQWERFTDLEEEKTVTLLDEIRVMRCSEVQPPSVSLRQKIDGKLKL